ncbi:hypothetical protein UT5_17200 [Ferrigenium sp. UT5]
MGLARRSLGDAQGATLIDAVEIGPAGTAHDARAMNHGMRVRHQRIQGRVIVKITRKPFNPGQLGWGSPVSRPI